MDENKKFGYSEAHKLMCEKRLGVAAHERELFKFVLFIETNSQTC